MRYIVVLTREEEVQAGPDEDDVMDVKETEVVLCEDSRAVHAAVRKGQPRFDKDWHEKDWAVFEVVGGKTERRALIFKMDGPISYDVEIT